MKRIVILINFLFCFAISSIAQENANYTTFLDSLANETLLKRIQYYLENEIILTKNDIPSVMEVTKKGVVKVVDKRITFPAGIEGVFASVTGEGITKTIWIKFKVPKSSESISLPFKAKDFGSTDPFIVEGDISSNKFTGTNTDTYTFTGKSNLQVSKKVEAELIKMQGIKVKN